MGYVASAMMWLWIGMVAAALMLASAVQESTPKTTIRVVVPDSLWDLWQ